MSTEGRRSSVWATVKDRPLDRGRKKKGAAGPVTFFVYLTTWQGGRVAVRYTRGKPFPMETVLLGGTYLLFSNGLLYVQESVEEINGRIQHRLHQMQIAWVPEI